MASFVEDEVARAYQQALDRQGQLQAQLTLISQELMALDAAKKSLAGGSISTDAVDALYKKLKGVS